MGRTTTALTGQEARGGAATDDRPYNETMAYDAMGHLKLRQIRQWDRSDSTGTETYINNRRQGWPYDADGRLLSSSTSTYTYDAAGRIGSFGDSDPYKTDQQLDGDGRRIKSVVQSLDPNTNQWTIEKTTYYVQSSVLKEVINEISEFGVKERGFVYSGGSAIAIQNAQGTANVTWENYDASDASYRPTDAQGQSVGPGELDPLGANAGTFKPFTWPPPQSSGKIEPYYGVPDLNSESSGCILDNISVPCDMATNDTSVQCENNQCKKGNKFFRAFNDGYADYLPADAQYKGYGWAWSQLAAKGSLDELASVVFLEPQQRTTGLQNLGRLSEAEHDILANDLNRHLSFRKDCIDFVQALLTTVATNTQRPAYDDVMDVFEKVRKQGGVVVDAEVGRRGHSAEAWGAISGNNSGNKATLRAASISFAEGEVASAVRGDMVLGEMLHFAAKQGVFLDSELAWAGYQVAWAQGYTVAPPPATNDTDKNSNYFHNTLQFAACNPYQKKK